MRGDRRPKKLEGEALWNYALRALSARALSVAEMRARLAARADRPEEANEVMARLRDLGLLDDVRFAEQFASARLENEGFGQGRVLSDLHRRRVASTVARRAVGAVFEHADEVQLIEDYLARKFRSVVLKEHLAEPRRMAAAYRRLRRAGFSSGNVVRVLRRHASETEVLESLAEGEERAAED